MLRTEVRVGGVSGGAGEQDGQGIRVRGLASGSKDMERSGSRVGRSRGLGFGWARQPLWRARDGRSRSGWAGAWVRRCQKGHARVPRGPGTGPGLEGGEEVGGQGSCSRPPYPYPPPRSRRSARCRCPPPAAAPAAASCCARGRPWPARRAQRGSAQPPPGR